MFVCNFILVKFFLKKSPDTNLHQVILNHIHLVRHLSMLMQILFPCCHPAPDVPLRLVRVQHLAGLAGKGRVDLEKAVGDVWWCQGRNKKINPFSNS